VKVTNGADVAVDIVVETEFGSKTFSDVQPGESANASINSRSAAIAAGEATVTATAEVDGDQQTVTKTAPYSAAG
jgi:hypothetical protein